MVCDLDESFMRKALEIATQDGVSPSMTPIGCVIVLDGQVIGAERNHVATHQDCTAHAEIETIRAAGRGRENGELRGAVLYSTLQPCGMCTMASIWSKVGRIVFGAGREDVHKMYFEARHVDTLGFIGEAYRDDLTITGGVLRELCTPLYYGPNDEVPKAEQGNI